jgi:hypothetical protein
MFLTRLRDHLAQATPLLPQQRVIVRRIYMEL